LKFRRQHPLGDYFLDFYCAECGLVVELDGSQHVDSPKDVARTRSLEARGLRPVRVWNDDVFLRIDDVLELIVAAASGAGVARRRQG
jgi:very-short-patch-repair endonuclease